MAEFRLRRSLNVGWEILHVVEYSFTIPDNISFQPCMQVRGGHTGQFSTQKTCNLN